MTTAAGIRLPGPDPKGMAIDKSSGTRDPMRTRVVKGKPRAWIKGAVKIAPATEGRNRNGTRESHHAGTRTLDLAQIGRNSPIQPEKSLSAGT